MPWADRVWVRCELSRRHQNRACNFVSSGPLSAHMAKHQQSAMPIYKYKLSAWIDGCRLGTPAYQWTSSDRNVSLSIIVMACCLPLLPFLYLILPAMLAVLSQQVDILMTDDMFSIARCCDIAPGVCCQPPQTRQGFPHITIYHMTFFDIGAIWSSGTNDAQWRGACGGRIVDSRQGPGWWDSREDANGWKIMHTARRTSISRRDFLPK